MTPLLITATEFSTYRDISKKIDSDKINECIKMAQNVDLYDVLGDFYFDLLDNFQDVSYNDLMNGSTFSYGGKNYRHEGIKSLLADYTYARYMYKINVNLTPFGATQKFGENSQNIDRNTLKDISKQTQIDAGITFQIIDKFLEVNKSTFSRYKCSNNPNINTFSNRFEVL